MVTFPRGKEEDGTIQKGVRWYLPEYSDRLQGSSEERNVGTDGGGDIDIKDVSGGVRLNIERR